MSPTISVVIPAFNEEKFLAKTLASLKAQDYQGEFEVIVVDNCSTDKTAAIAKKSGAKVISELNQGVQFARQAGFQLAIGQFIASTDADDVVPRNWLSKIVAEFEKNPKLVGLSGSITPLDGTLTEKIFLLVHTGTNLLQSFVRFSFFTGQNFAVRRVVFEAVGGFDLSSASSEEGDLFAKIKHFGEVKYLPRLTVAVSMRRIRSLGFAATTWWSFKAWFSLNVFKNSARPGLSTVRRGSLNNQGVLDHLVLITTTVLFTLLLSFLLILFFIPGVLTIASKHFLIVPRTIALKRLAVASVVALVILIPVTLFIWSSTSFAKESEIFQRIKYSISSLNLNERLKNLKDLQVPANFDSEQIQKIFQISK